jgi:hypothetical protein
MAMGWGLVALVRWAVRRVAPRPSGAPDVRAEAAALAIGAAAVIACFLAGPLGPGHPRDGIFANSYVRLGALPAFDVPWPGASPFYERLARMSGEVRVIEAPGLRSRGMMLYRSHFLRHRRPVRIGLAEGELAALLGDPYVFLLEPRVVPGDGEEYLLYHRDPRGEIERYWRFVYEEAWPAERRAGDSGFMERNRKVHDQPGRDPEGEVRLRVRFGEPVYEDRDLLVWRLAEGSYRR